jgi:Tfp pilus assembly protein PilO
VKLGTQVWGLLTVVVAIGALAAGWFLGVSPLLTAQAQAESQRQASLTQNQGIEANIASLAKEQDNLADYEKRAAEIKKVIPSGLESAAFITTLNNLAAATQVTIQQISINEVVPYSAPAGESTSDGAPKPITDSRITGENFLLVPVSISVTGGWNEVLAFSHGVQAGDRLMLVTKINTSNDGAAFTTTLSGTMYVLIRPDAPTTAATEDVASDPDAASEG